LAKQARRQVPVIYRKKAPSFAKKAGAHSNNTKRAWLPDNNKGTSSNKKSKWV